MFFKANITPSRNSSCPIPWHLSQRPSFAASMAKQSKTKSALHESDTADHITIAPRPRLAKYLQARQRSIIALLTTIAKETRHSPPSPNQPSDPKSTYHPTTNDIVYVTHKTLHRPSNQSTNQPSIKTKPTIPQPIKSFIFYLADKTLNRPTNNHSTENEPTIQ